MGPGMVGGTYLPKEIRFHTRFVVENKGAKFIRDKAVSIDPIKQQVQLKTESEPISYDVLSCNVGSYVPHLETIDQKSFFAAKPIEGLIQAQQKILKKSQNQQQYIAVIGGGPSSVEIAGNIWQLTETTPYPPVITIFAGKELMHNHPKRIREMIRRILSQRGIQFVEGSYVDSMKYGKIRLEDDREYTADLIFPAIGVKPSPIFLKSQLPTGPDGGLKVNKYLQSTAHANIFGGGDCIYFQPQPLDKVGVYAVRQNPVLFHNLMASLTGKDLQVFSPGGSYLRIYNLGGAQGVFYKWPFMFSGKLAFWIKDHIDRKFIRSFTSNE
jgi:NADH dehydrogenase FAD-containing subunit